MGFFRAFAIAIGHNEAVRSLRRTTLRTMYMIAKSYTLSILDWHTALNLLPERLSDFRCDKVLMRICRLAILCFLWLDPTVTMAQNEPSVSIPSDRNPTTSIPPTPEQLHFFESSVRPLLIEKCFECHASHEGNPDGGLTIDSLEGILRGGDSGPAIDRDSPLKSPLLQAIEYRKPDLQMPPGGKLSESQIGIFRTWIQDGTPAPDSFRTEMLTTHTSEALSVENALSHWAYRPIAHPVPPATSSRHNPIDAFLETHQSSLSLRPSSLVSDRVWARRLSMDLHGFNPTYEQLMALDQQFAKTAPQTVSERPDSSNYGGDGDIELREQWVDAILASPRFGERFARKWMDVVRYAESLTLRGFILPDVWRYRNYLIDSFNADAPFDQMILEQIAGDLLYDDDPQVAARRWVATTALAIGDLNYEEQDKQQLEMDAIDEQLDTVSKAFLAQTLSCARCHDHKFDPIPTSDYYALAGIFKSSVAMDHENVSKWVRMPLPVSEDQQAIYELAGRASKELQREIGALRKVIGNKPKGSLVIPSSDFHGVVIDNRTARIVGDWQSSSSVAEYIDADYLHDKNQDRGSKSATFEPLGLQPGSYTVRIAYAHGENRSSKTLVRISSADGDKTVLVNQRRPAEDDGLWQSLGKIRVEKDGQAFVIVSNEEADGYVIVDAVQFLPDGLSPRRENQTSLDASVDATDESEESGRLHQLKQWESALSATQELLDERPMVQTLRASEKPADIAIHVRGSVHRLGAIVPRGFLSVIDRHDPELASRYRIAADANGRLELAQWLVDPNNPLTARVIVNRIWSWLMGDGLVRTIDNFGTTGDAPSQPELLDYLTSEFIAHGWSIKWLVRTIVTSDAYRRSSNASNESFTMDPENKAFARGGMRRLDAESFRDSLLQASGELSLGARYDSNIRRGSKEDYRYQHEAGLRSIYLPWFRNTLPELIREFDGANPSFSISSRNRSTVATQALAIMNSEWIRDRASHAASRVLQKEPIASPSQVILSFRTVLGRDPSESELLWAKGTLQSTNLTELVHQLMASIDFRYCP